eukprot:g6569.t1
MDTHSIQPLRPDPEIRRGSALSWFGQLHSANVTAKRKDEIFKRIRPSTLVRLLQEREVSESVYAVGLLAHPRSPRGVGGRG